MGHEHDWYTLPDGSETCSLCNYRELTRLQALIAQKDEELDAVKRAVDECRKALEAK